MPDRNFVDSLRSDWERKLDDANRIKSDPNSSEDDKQNAISIADNAYKRYTEAKDEQNISDQKRRAGIFF